MSEFYNARNEKVFKAIFFDPNDTELLETLLSLIFNKKVKEIEFDNPELLTKNVIERTKISDFVVHIDDKIFHIELNHKDEKWLNYRNFETFVSIYNKYVEINCRYNTDEIFAHIDFAYGLSEKLDTILYYSLQTADHIKYIDSIHLVEFNMDRIKKTWYDETDERKKQLFYYLTKFDINQDELDEKEDDAFVKKLKSKIKKLNQDKNFVSFLSYEDDLKFQKNTELNLAREEGEKAKSFEIAKKKLNRGDSIEDIIDLTGLSKNEIENLK